MPPNQFLISSLWALKFGEGRSMWGRTGEKYGEKKHTQKQQQHKFINPNTFWERQIVNRFKS